MEQGCENKIEKIKIFVYTTLFLIGIDVCV